MAFDQTSPEKLSAKLSPKIPQKISKKIFGHLARGYGFFERLARICLTALFILLLAAVLLALASAAFNALFGSQMIDSQLLPRERSRRANVIVFEPAGAVREYYPAPRSESFAEAAGSAVLQLAGEGGEPYSEQEMIMALDKAAADPKVRAVVYINSYGWFESLRTMDAVAQAFSRVRAAGKTVLSFGPIDRQTYLASSAADIIMADETDAFMLVGPSYVQQYFKGFFDKFSLDSGAQQAGAYKSGVEPYLRNSMSEQVKQNFTDVFGAMWNDELAAAEKNRGLAAGSLTRYIDSYDELYKKSGGLMADAAREAGLITATYEGGMSEGDAIENALSAALDLEAKKLFYDDYSNYVSRDYARAFSGGGAYNIAVIPLDGEIVSGYSSDGTIGDRSVAELLWSLREDENIRAAVLRINSPGGSFAASFAITRELRAFTRDTGIPLIISMGDAAASGGYMIATAGDAILAEDFTVTGSIGVYAVAYNVARALEALGIYSDGYRTTWLSGDDALSTPSKRMKDFSALTTDLQYAQFVSLVAQSRGMSEEEAERAAQGKIYTGAQAAAAGLVDAVGGLEDAIALAAKKAEIDEPHAAYIAPLQSAAGFSPVDFIYKLFPDFLGRALGRIFAGLFDESSARAEMPVRVPAQQ